MIAVSILHGGLGPNFLSQDLVSYFSGQDSFKATVEDMTYAEMGKVLNEVWGYLIEECEIVKYE